MFVGRVSKGGTHREVGGRCIEPPDVHVLTPRLKNERKRHFYDSPSVYLRCALHGMQSILNIKYKMRNTEQESTKGPTRKRAESWSFPRSQAKPGLPTEREGEVLWVTNSSRGKKETIFFVILTVEGHAPRRH